jgi:hypothetical protein
MEILVKIKANFFDWKLRPTEARFRALKKWFLLNKIAVESWNSF